MTYLGSKLNHTLFAFGHLNAIKYFKCQNNHKLKCLLLVIFQTVALSSFMILGSVQVFFNNALKRQKNRKEKEIKKEAETYLRPTYLVA